MKATSWNRDVSEDELRDAAKHHPSLKKAIESLRLGCSYEASWHYLAKYHSEFKRELQSLIGTELLVRVVVLCVSGCGRPQRSQKRPSKHGLCKPCYHCMLKGLPIGNVKVVCKGKECVLDGCLEIQYAKELCNFHWQRLRKHGDPGGVESTGVFTQVSANSKTRTWDRPLIERKCRIKGCRLVPTSSNICENHRSLERYKAKKAARQKQNLSITEWDRIAAWEAILLGEPCAYCGAPSDTIDHVQPTSKGGAWTEDNLVGACRRCNSGKRDTPLLTYLLRKLDRLEVMGNG